MSGVGSINLKVLIFDSDIYALQAINSYLAWDRRTRVTFMTNDIDAVWKHLQQTPKAELPDIAILDFDHFGSLAAAHDVLDKLLAALPNLVILCMVQHIDLELAELAAKHGARAFLAKHDVGIRIAWAIVYALRHEMLVTVSVARQTKNTLSSTLYNAAILPEQRDYPEMTGRIRQAIRLCVIEGMPAHLAADEMGISLHTIRGYVKEGYRILESYDQHEYPTDMTPQERAFMRFTALDSDDV